MTTPYSLSNAPQAPVKAKAKPSLLQRRRARLDAIPPLRFPDEAKPEWKVLAESGMVRWKYLTWTPPEVAKVTSLELLHDLRR